MGCSDGNGGLADGLGVAGKLLDRTEEVVDHVNSVGSADPAGGRDGGRWREHRTSPESGAESSARPGAEPLARPGAGPGAPPDDSTVRKPAVSGWRADLHHPRAAARTVHRHRRRVPRRAHRCRIRTPQRSFCRGRSCHRGSRARMAAVPSGTRNALRNQPSSPRGTWTPPPPGSAPVPGPPRTARPRTAELRQPHGGGHRPAPQPSAQKPCGPTAPEEWTPVGASPPPHRYGGLQVPRQVPDRPDNRLADPPHVSHGHGRRHSGGSRTRSRSRGLDRDPDPVPEPREYAHRRAPDYRSEHHRPDHQTQLPRPVPGARSPLAGRPRVPGPRAGGQVPAGRRETAASGPSAVPSPRAQRAGGSKRSSGGSQDEERPSLVQTGVCRTCVCRTCVDVRVSAFSFRRVLTAGTARTAGTSPSTGTE